MRSLPNTSARDRQWESNPRPLDTESVTLTTRLYAPTIILSRGPTEELTIKVAGSSWKKSKHGQNVYL